MHSHLQRIKAVLPLKKRNRKIGKSFLALLHEHFRLNNIGCINVLSKLHLELLMFT